MFEVIWEQIQALLGLGVDVEDVDAVQMAFRTFIIYVFSLAIVRLGSKRFLGRGAAFDVIVGIMLGSVMSRAINGSAPFFPTLAAGAALVALHWLFGVIAFRFGWFGTLVKGESVLLIKDGRIHQPGVTRTSVTPLDLEEAQRLQGQYPNVADVQLAYLERSGKISVVTRPREPRVFTVSVEDGVQTVRIELG